MSAGGGEQIARVAQRREQGRGRSPQHAVLRLGEWRWVRSGRGVAPAFARDASVGLGADGHAAQEPDQWQGLRS